MDQVPVTRPSLLIRIRNRQDEEAWRQFVRLYTPVVYGYARRRGLQDADAADIAQEVLQSVSVAVSRWDAARGTFRSWLFTIAHHKVHDWLARRNRESAGDSGTQEILSKLPAANDERIWETEYETQLFAWAAKQAQEQFEPSTWCAFQLTAVEGKSGKEAAGVLGLSVAAVYLAKSRVVARLRELIEQLEQQ